MKKIILKQEIIEEHFNNLKLKLEELEFLLKKNDSPYKFEDVITAKPDILKDIADWSCRNKNIDFSFMQKKYENFIQKKKEYNAYDLAKNLGVIVCPYCNINSIYTIIKKNNEQILRPEFDHFFDKATYPILSLSIYNLIPSCHQCNSNLKGSKNFDLQDNLHPYIDDFDKELKFQIKISNSKFYYSTEGFQILITSKNKKAQNHIEIFKLEERYEKFKNIVLELIQKKYMYNESYLDELYKKYEGTFFRNKEDLIRLISCAYVDENINQRPLSKMIKDIIEELKIYY